MCRASLVCTARYDTDSDIDNSLMPIRCVQIGMMSEQSMERQNHTFKRYARLYATMGNTKKRLNTTMKRAYMAVHPSIPPFAPPKRLFKGPRKAKRNKVTTQRTNHPPPHSPSRTRISEASR